MNCLPKKKKKKSYYACKLLVLMTFYCAKKDPKQNLIQKRKNKNSKLTKSSQMQMKVDALWVPLARHPNATHKAVRIALLPLVNPKNQTTFH